MVPLKISIPKDIAPGTTSSVRIEFKTVEESTPGVTMGTGMTVSFKVIAGEEMAEISTWKIVAVIAAIIILAWIIWLLVKKKKKKRK